jgi:hypothetical protein
MRLVALAIAGFYLVIQPSLAIVSRSGGPSAAAVQSAPSAQPGPRGKVRLVGRVLQDDRGPFLGLGATLFWSVWGYQHDRARLIQHFELLRAHGFEFVRVLGAVAGPSWRDRMADPRVIGYDAAIAGVTDLAFEHGLRIGWTVFGDTVAATSPAARQAVIDRFLAMSKGREHKILFIEVANEGWQNGFENRLEELQALGRSLNARTDVPITLTSPPPPLGCGKDLASIYRAGAADFLTLHFSRDLKTPDGRWGPVREPLKWPGLFESCRAGLPEVAANGEPIGPQSSVASEDDPLHVLTGAAVTFTAGLPIHVWHTGPGVRGGGVADRAVKRAVNLAELPRVDEMLKGFAALKTRIPPDLPGWSRVEPVAHDNLLQLQVDGALGPIGAVAARRGGAIVLVPFGIRDPISVRASGGAEVEVIHPVNGTIITAHTLSTGERLPLPDKPAAYVIVGRGR